MSKYTMVLLNEEGDEVLIDQVTVDNFEALKWWIETSLNDFRVTVPKIEEYGGAEDGSADLRIMGRNLGELLEWPEEDLNDPVLQELAVWFYTQGKVGRLVSNYKQHRPGKADTWLDVTVYSMMARCLQDKGRWP